jgi:hypothetical protein
MTVAQTPRRSRARGVLRGLPWVLAALFVAGIAAAEWWYWPREIPLAADWTASVVALAGDGTAGHRDGAAASSRFAEPFGIAAGRDGTLFVADAGETPAIRVLTPQGRVFTLAGGTRGFRDGRATGARFDTPSGIAIDGSGAVIVADTANNAIRRVTPDGDVTTIAGGGAPGHLDGDARSARFNGPIAVAVDPHDGRILVADSYNDRIRAIDRHGLVTTVAGSVRGFQDGAGTAALFDTPAGITVAPDGTIVVADTGNGVVRTIDASGVVTTPSHAPGMSTPIGVAVGAAGEVFAAEERGRIVAFPLRAAGAAPGTDQIRGRTIAGSRPGFRDGSGLQAEFRRPSGIAILGEGRLAVADAGNALIRLVADPSRMSVRPPAAPHVRPAFDISGFSRLPLLWPVAPLDGPFEIAGTLGEARGAAAERLHGGVDIRLPQGTPVRAVRSGVVESPIAAGSFGTLNEWMRIGGISYVHVRVGRSRDNELVDRERFVGDYDDRGRLAGMRVKRGARFVTGEVIASINPFNHVHLTIGWPGEEFNPLDYRLVNFEDSIPPTIPANGVRLSALDGTPLADRVGGRLLVHGAVRVVVEAWDQAEGNQANRRLGPYALGYQVLHPSGVPVPGFEEAVDSIVFDRFAGDRTAANLIYAPGSGIPFYSGGRTRFLYTVTNTLRGGVAAEGAWHAAALAPGDYTLRVWASDAAGNTTTRDVGVTVASGESQN